MICHFLVLEAPLSCSKRFENFPASVKSKIRFITPAKMSFPGQKESSPAFTARQRNGPRQVQQPGGVVRPQELNSAASVIAKEELYHRQDHRCSFKSDPQWVISLGEEKRPRPATKLLLSVLIKA